MLDVNLLLACGWQTHAEHAQALAWLGDEAEFFTCPLVELGFIRVSMGPAYRASFADAVEALLAIKRRANARVIPVNFDATKLPPLSAHGDVTDAYLASLAREHGLQLATLDVPLTKKPWALSVAFRPFEKLTQG